MAKKELDSLMALQSQAAAAYARSPSIANRTKLRRAQQAVADYKKRPPRITATRSEGGPGDKSNARVVEPAKVTPFSERAYDRKQTASAPASDPRVRQQQLKDLGFYKGRIDGIWGPLSRAAEAAWEAAGKPTTGQAAGPSLTAVASPSGGGDPSSPAMTSSSAPMPTGLAGRPPISTGDFRARVLAELPSAAAFLDIPDLVPHLQARLNGEISDQEFAARVQNTNWWRTTPARSRQWMGLYALDPATAERQIDERTANVKRAADDYFVPMADVTAREWSKKVLSGEIPEEAFNSYLREQAKSIMPPLAGAIDRGITPSVYADPYRQVAAQTLEINPNEINFTDPRWQRALMQVDKDGNRTSMSLADWQTTLRSDPAYGFDNTQQARREAAMFAVKLQETFGKA